MMRTIGITRLRLPGGRCGMKSRAAGRLTTLGALVAGIALLFFLIHPVKDSSTATSPLPGIKIGQPAPSFALTDLDGKTVRLADLRGRWVLLNFWGVTCPPCAQEIPALERAYKTVSGTTPAAKRPTIIGIDGDLDSAKAAETFARRLGVTYPILLDVELSAVTRYHVGQIPTSLFLDPKGRIAAIHTGPLQTSQIQRGLHGKFPL
jgi:peroxiredoxin